MNTKNNRKKNTFLNSKSGQNKHKEQTHIKKNLWTFFLSAYDYTPVGTSRVCVPPTPLPVARPPFGPPHLPWLSSQRLPCAPSRPAPATSGWRTTPEVPREKKKKKEKKKRRNILNKKAYNFFSGKVQGLLTGINLLAHWSIMVGPHEIVIDTPSLLYRFFIQLCFFFSLVLLW